MRRLVLVLLVSSTVTAAPDKDPYAAWRDSIAKIVARSYEPGALAQLTELGDTIGPRITGSPAYTKATEWAASQLRAAGAHNVHFEKFKLEHGWQRGTARAAIVGAPAALHIASLGWSPSTPGTVRGQAVIATYEAVPAKLAGKIVVIRRKSIQNGPGAWLARRKAITDFKAAGAIALLVEAVAPNNVLFTGAPFGGKLTPLPAAIVGQEDAALINRLADRGPVTLELQIANTITGPIEVANVIGELPGTDPEWLLIGAHLDSWDFGTGSSDNGSGTIQVLQTVRALAAAGPLRRTVRFALFGGEEQGAIGSHSYVLAHAAELDKCVMMINTDSGAGHVRGWRVQNRKDVETPMAPIAKSLLASLGGELVDPVPDLASDHVSFIGEGVPTLDLSVDETIYEVLHHTPADTVDKVDAHALASGVAVMAVTAYAIASSPVRLAPRLDRRTVEAQLKPSGTDALLRAEGWWK